MLVLVVWILYNSPNTLTLILGAINSRLTLCMQHIVKLGINGYMDTVIREREQLSNSHYQLSQARQLAVVRVSCAAV